MLFVNHGGSTVNKQSDRNDNFLQNNPDDINDEELMKQKQKLANDFETPFSEPDNTKEPISKDAQQADPALDTHEIYDEGFSSSTEKKVNSVDDKSDKEDFDEDMHIEDDGVK